MKTTSSSSMTSMRLTTLISALSASPSRRRRATLDLPLANHHRDDLRSEGLELAVDAVHAICEEVVAEDGGDGDGERGRGRDERFGDARRDRADVPRPLGRDADER